jgi:hypothetical protein
MIFFLVNEVTPRWVYTLDFIFKVRGLSYQITEDLELFNKSVRPKINCSKHESNATERLVPAKILGEYSVRKVAISKGDFEGAETLILDSQTCLLGSVFYVLSRYEEYIIKERDIHGRFFGQNSCLFEYDWIQTPICDKWAVVFINYISEKLNTSQVMTVKPCRLIPTFDIDNSFAYKYKTGYRKWMSCAKDVFKLNFPRLKERLRVQSGKQKDPYDTFDYICSLNERGFAVKVFWLLGDFGPFDRNLSNDVTEQQDVIREMAQHVQLGIHPSYQSNIREFKVKQEWQRLQTIVGDIQKIRTSRQHFLKLNLPNTYLNLLKYGLNEDFSMGFADIPGFRIGTAHKVYWYDLHNDKISGLRIRPLIYMDGTLNEYLKLSPAAAKEVIYDLFMEVKKYGGDFIFLWHNETIGENRHWKGWSEVLEYTLSLHDEIK